MAATAGNALAGAPPAPPLEGDDVPEGEPHHDDAPGVLLERAFDPMALAAGTTLDHVITHIPHIPYYLILYG